jgi:hypothetical protein
MGVVKTWNGIARASLKTWDGIAAASVKTINGFDATTGVSYDFEENFETATTGYENSGWTTVGTGNPAYSTSPAPLAGTQSLYTGTGTSLSGARRARSATGEVWFYWMMYCITGVVDDTFFFADSGLGNNYLGFSSGKMRIRLGGSIAAGASAFPLDTLMHVWYRFQPGSGTANADLYYSTDGVRGTAKASVTGATYTTEADRPYWHNRSTYGYLFDRIIINATAIGDNPT